VTPGRAASRRQGSRRHHPQDACTSDPRHPQTLRAGVAGDEELRADPHSHHPQRARRPERTSAGDSTARRDGDGRIRQEPHSPDGPNTPSGHGRCTAEPPRPGALRPLARALLSAADETHAARSEARRVTCPGHERTLRMAEPGGRLPLREGLRLGLRSPATPEGTGSEDAYSHVTPPAPPPVKNSDCIGDCA
jgi:hypothetical protein